MEMATVREIANLLRLKKEDAMAKGKNTRKETKKPKKQK